MVEGYIEGELSLTLDPFEYCMSATLPILTRLFLVLDMWRGMIQTCRSNWPCYLYHSCT